ncbi:MAG: hypothetical protein GY803_02070 [Chloroflexi bacterium]|nr:hypothetical protein [Chloroflexota bacterium]
MGIKINHTEGLGTRFFKSNAVEWQTISDLLNDGNYERAAALLQQYHVAFEQENDPVLASILAAVHQLCLSCKQHRSEIDLHQQAYVGAVERERELRQQLTEILGSAGDYLASRQSVRSNISLPVDVSLKKSEKSGISLENDRTIWQWVQTLFGRGRSAVALELKTQAGLDGVANAESEKIDIFSIESDTAVPHNSTIPEPGATVSIQSPNRHQSKRKDGPSLAMYLLGAFRVYDNGSLLDKWTGNKGKSILKYMVAHRERPIHREVLMDLFWQDDSPEVARRNLYQAIYMMRQTLQSGHCPDFQHILCENSAYFLNPDLSLWVDSEAFESHYQSGLRFEKEGKKSRAIQEYEAADTLYDGDFLTEDLYEEWPLINRENMKHAHLDILDRLSQYYCVQKQYTLCVSNCRKILAEDNCREDAHRRLMLTYLHQGQRHLALRQYHRCVEALRQELDVSPMPATVELYQRILNDDTQITSA